MDTTLAAALVLLVAFTPLGCEALLIRALRVPAWAQLHQPATLRCEYDPQEQPLYSVKWYKNRKEFYRYLKEERPQIRTFNMAGVHVDVEQSNDTTLRLSDVERDTAGEYTCEVSMDAPTFLTAVSSAHLNVISLPEKGPRITGVADAYLPGEAMLANCSIGAALPRATLHWYLNGKQVDSTYLISPAPTPPPVHPAPNWLALRLPVDAGLFGHGHTADLRCQAFVADIRHGEDRFSAVLKDLLPPGNQRLSQHGAAPALAAPSGLLVLAAVIQACLRSLNA